jgi:hypothetical protein
MTDVAQIVRDYEAWKAQQQFQDDDGENYARHLETQKKLRILKAIQNHFDITADSFIQLGNVRYALDGGESAIKALEEALPF